MTICDDWAVYRLLAGTVKQARKDLVRRAVKPEHRITAVELFLTIGGYDDADDDTGGEGCRQIQPARAGSRAGAAVARRGAAAVARKEA